MRKRDTDKERKEILHALAMILQMGLAVLVCMGMSLAIGYYIDRLFQTKIWVLIMMAVGILAAIRSMLVLAGRYDPEAGKMKMDDTPEQRKDGVGMDGEGKDYID